MDSFLAVIEHRRDCSPPARLWRVSHSRNRDALFCARLPCLLFEDYLAFEFILRQHLVWGNRDETPFLSTFSNKDNAVNWGRRLLGEGDVWIYAIDTNGLTVFPTETDEYLILGSIPKNNICESQQVREYVDPEYVDSDFWCGYTGHDDRRRENMVRHEETGLYYDPDDDAGRQEDQDWIEYASSWM
ncbi:hypothetical protein PHYPSEUDO_003250 [Phytophthora pseudosyringae]|uniref:Uncharacterized protein n=1 Tax=Phytophthora pseudosyringae TaxID=221518 RepID=A0A8T1V470_9STRA|nr:hypothetical protein PHYPSEUDO_003250 [Phytophthora pseudosyringae]